jgi:hypothetical protein
MTKVKFLIHSDPLEMGNDDLFAFFPDDICDHDGNLTSYAHVGQHSACCQAYADESREATKEEYKGLLEELVSIGYDDLLILNEDK